MIKGDILGALKMNPNCLFAIFFLCVYPIILLLSIIRGKEYLSNIYQILDKALKNKICLYTLLVSELIIWVHNFLTGT